MKQYPKWWIEPPRPDMPPGFHRKPDRKTEKEEPLLNLFMAPQMRILELMKQLTERIEE